MNRSRPREPRGGHRDLGSILPPRWAPQWESWISARDQGRLLKIKLDFVGKTKEKKFTTELQSMLQGEDWCVCVFSSTTVLSCWKRPWFRQATSFSLKYLFNILCEVKIIATTEAVLIEKYFHCFRVQSNRPKFKPFSHLAGKYVLTGH